MFEDTKVNQLFAAFIVASGGISTGMAIGWSATALPDYDKSGSIGVIGRNEKAWMASLSTVGALLSAALGGKIMNTLGRKGSLLLNCAECVIGWTLLVVATQPAYIYCGRVLIGIAAAGCCVVVPIFLREISSVQNRGALGSSFVIMMCVGKLYTNAVGSITSASRANFACLLQPICHGIFLLFIPESPVCLVQKKRIKDARNALRWLNQKGLRWPWEIKVEDSADAMEADISASVQQITELSFRKVDPTTWKTCFTFEILKPLFTAFLIMILCQFTGPSAVTYYTLEIFNASGEFLVDPKVAIVTISILQTLACFPAYYFVDKYGRKILFLSSYTVMAMSMIVLAAFFFVKDLKPEILASYACLRIIPMIGVLVYYISFCWGLASISFMVVAEILPPQVVGMGSAICSIIYWAGAFATTQCFQMYIEVIPIRVWFVGFAGMCVFGLLFTKFCMPETKGLTLEEIQAFYANSRKSKKACGELG